MSIYGRRGGGIGAAAADSIECKIVILSLSLLRDEKRSNTKRRGKKKAGSFSTAITIHLYG